MWENIGFILTVVVVAYVYLRLILPKFGMRS